MTVFNSLQLSDPACTIAVRTAASVRSKISSTNLDQACLQAMSSDVRFYSKCTKRNFAERLRKPTWTAEAGYAEHGSKSSIEGALSRSYANATRAVLTTLFAYAGASSL